MGDLGVNINNKVAVVEIQRQAESRNYDITPVKLAIF